MQINITRIEQVESDGIAAGSIRGVKAYPR